MHLGLQSMHLTLRRQQLLVESVSKAGFSSEAGMSSRQWMSKHSKDASGHTNLCAPMQRSVLVLTVIPHMAICETAEKQTSSLFAIY